MTLQRYLTPDAARSGSDLDAIFSEPYTEVRTSIFHTKSGRPYLLPQRGPDRTRVQDTLERYASLYTDLAEIQFKTRFLRSGMSQYAFNRIAEGIFATTVCGVTAAVYADVDAFDTDEAAATFTAMPTERAGRLDGPFRAALLGELRLAAQAGPIRFVGARTTEGQGVTVESLRGVLDLEGVATLQHQLTYQLFNSGVKSRYET